jgi:hypothetical protein
MINKNVCDGCRQSLDRRRRSHVELGPMLHDSIWNQIADPAEALCSDNASCPLVEKIPADVPQAKN